MVLLLVYIAFNGDIVPLWKSGPEFLSLKGLYRSLGFPLTVKHAQTLWRMKGMVPHGQLALTLSYLHSLTSKPHETCAAPVSWATV
jgi:hypothetical protein